MPDIPRAHTFRADVPQLGRWPQRGDFTAAGYAVIRTGASSVQSRFRIIAEQAEPATVSTHRD
jgi:hypothetical protein